MLPTFVFVSCLVLITSANEQLWNEFKVQNGKVYSTDIEHQLRYSIFNRNLQKIQEHNAKYVEGTTSWYMGVNQFTDLTEDEFNQILAVSKFDLTEPASRKQYISTSATPDVIDWRDKGVVTNVTNQGNCGSSWIFSTVGTLEGQYALEYGQLVPLSVQNLEDCCNSGCSGGNVETCLDYIKDSGIATEDSYPSEASQGSCKKGDVIFHISGFTEIEPNNESDLKNAVGSVGPVSVSLNANLFQFYSGGVFNDSSCPILVNHAMLIVGYGKEDGKNYWILKNSWGPSWGEAGYIRIATGFNLCGLASQAYYPIP